MALLLSFARTFLTPFEPGTRAPYRLVVAVLAALLLVSSTARAQHVRRPFSEVALYAGLSSQVGANQFGDFYQPHPGFDAAATTPFYAGTAGLDLGLRRYEARPDRAGEDFWAVPAALRWGLRPSLDARLRAEGAVRLGGLFMRFSDGGPGLRNESELLMGADAGLSLPLGGRWRLAVGVRYEYVFTTPSIRLWHVRAGIRRRFDAPHWLRTLLR